MSNLSSYGYGISDTEHLGVSAYGYGQGVPLGLVANLDLLTTLNAGLEVPSGTVNLLQATLSLETGFSASLQQLVAEILTSLDLETQLDAALTQPIVELVATLGLETDLDASLQFITLGELLASLDLTTDLDGALQFIAISEIVASLNLETSFSSVLESTSIRELLASLDLEFGSQAVLDPPSATIKELEAALGLEVDLVTAFLVPPKVIVDQKLLFGGLGPPPPGFLEFLRQHGPFLSSRQLGEAPKAFQEYLKRDLNKVGAFTSGYIFFPVLSVQFKPSDDGPELEPKLIVIGEPQEISYEPKKPGGATLFKP